MRNRLGEALNSIRSRRFVLIQFRFDFNFDKDSDTIRKAKASKRERKAAIGRPDQKPKTPRRAQHNEADERQERRKAR